jgi:Family of unknown function (DUF5684)
MGYFAQTYNYDFTSGSQSSTSSGDEMMIFGVILGSVVAIFLLYLLPQIIMSWKLFKKAGEPGWAAIVPVYHEWISCKIAKAPQWLLISIIVVSYVLSSIPYLGLLFILPSFALNLYLLILFAKQYDRKTLFWVLYVFLPIVAVFMVGKAKYIGGTQQPQQQPVPAVNNATIAAAPPQPVNQNVNQ